MSYDPRPFDPAYERAAKDALRRNIEGSVQADTGAHTVELPPLPERTNGGFEEHPDWERTEDGRGLRHKPTGWVYLGRNDGKEAWKHS